MTKFPKNFLSLYKFSGSGNDFFIFDCRGLHFDPLTLKRILPLCNEVDGLLVVEDSAIANCCMRIFNTDGSEATMCGNGLRCVAAFLKSPACSIETPKDPLLKVHRCRLYPEGIFAEMGSPMAMHIDKEIIIDDKPYTYDFLNTGTPHCVLSFSEIQTPDVLNLGSKIRFHKDFAPFGTNVNFASLKQNGIFLRTYEKGVERETEACGTGAIATALCFAKRYHMESPITLHVGSGEKLIVSFSYKNGRFETVGLLGSVRDEGFSSWELSSFEL